MLNSMKRRGFSVAELIIVISIIGILISLGVVNFNNTNLKARDRKRIEDINAIALHLESYYNKNGYYPYDIPINEAEAQSLLVDIDPKNLKAPGQESISLKSTGSASQDLYFYRAQGRSPSYEEIENCNNSYILCRSFTLEVVLEEKNEDGDHKSYKVKSKNQ